MKYLIIGASSIIAQAFIKELKAQTLAPEIVTVSRQKYLAQSSSEHFPTDYSIESTALIAKTLADIGHKFDQIVFFNGQLHNDTYTPEKRISRFDESYFQWLLQCNVLSQVRWFQYLPSLIDRHSFAKITVFSARIGSLEDNHSGGWYSYRMSKAALNMATKSFAIELARTHPNTQTILFHPGTTDTPLSKPFQHNVASDKLFEPEFVAKQLYQLQQKEMLDKPVCFVDWQHQTIKW